MVGILTCLVASCARKAVEEPVHAGVVPHDIAGEATSEQGTETKMADDSSDLANQLRDPDLLNRLDDPSLQDAGNAPGKPAGSTSVIIKGSDAPPEPIEPPKTAPSPPIGKPEWPAGAEDRSRPSSGPGN